MLCSYDGPVWMRRKCLRAGNRWKQGAGEMQVREADILGPRRRMLFELSLPDQGAKGESFLWYSHSC